MTKEEKIAAVRFTLNLIHNLTHEAHDDLYEQWNDLDTTSARCSDKPMEANLIKETICEILLNPGNYLPETIGELKVGNMPGFKCPMCGKGRMVTEIIADHHTKLGGQPVRVKDARMAKCDHCSETSILITEIQRWEKIQQEHKKRSENCS